MIINIPACPNCGALAHNVPVEDVQAAGGFINCEYCDYPAQPDENGLNIAAIEMALDEYLTVTTVAVNSLPRFFAEVQVRVIGLRQTWMSNYADEFEKWSALHK